MGKRRPWRKWGGGGEARIMTRLCAFPRYLCAVGGALRVLYHSKLLLAICLPSGLARERIPCGLIDRSVADQRLIIDDKPKRCRGSFENLGRIPRANRLVKKPIWRDRFSQFIWNIESWRTRSQSGDDVAEEFIDWFVCRPATVWESARSATISDWSIKMRRARNSGWIWGTP